MNSIFFFLLIFVVFYGGDASQENLAEPTETRFQRNALAAAPKEFEPSKQDLQGLRDWIAKNRHIVQDYDDEFLSAFFRGFKGNLEKVKTALESFNGLGKRYPHMIKNYDPLDPLLVENLSETMTFVLPKKAPDGSTVFFAAYRHFDDFKSNPYKAHAAEYYRYWLLSVYTSIWKKEFDSGKWTLVTDFEGSTLPQTREITPTLLKQAVDMMQNALPINLQAVHIINVPPFLIDRVNLAKKLMNKEYADKVHLHPSMAHFYKKFPKEIFPKEYGGSEESAFQLHNKWFSTVKSFRNKFLEEESKMRELDPFRPKTNDALRGNQGN